MKALRVAPNIEMLHAVGYSGYVKLSQDVRTMCGLCEWAACIVVVSFAGHWCNMLERTQNADKSLLLKSLDEAWHSFSDTFAGVTEAQTVDKDFDQWSLKDILSHVIGWNEVISESLERVARGEPPIRVGSGDEVFNAWNEKFVADRQHFSPHQVIEELEESFRRFRAAFQSFPEQKYDERLAERIEFEISHYQEHTHQLREWRKTLRSSNQEGDNHSI